MSNGHVIKQACCVRSIRIQASGSAISECSYIAGVEGITDQHRWV